MYGFGTRCFGFSLACVRWVFERGGRLFVDWILTRVPFGHHAFLLKSSKLPAIVDRGQKFPQQKDGQPNQNNGCNHGQYNSQHEHLRWTFPFFLGLHYDLLSAVVVGELVPAVILVEEGTLVVVLLFVDLHLLDRNRHEQSAVGGTIRRISQRTRLVLLTLDAVFELIAPSRTGWALLAESARVATLLSYLTSATSALASTMTGAYFSTSRWDTAFVGSLAVTCRSRPAFLTDTLSAGALPLLRPGTQQPIVTITGKVITFAELTGDDLLRVDPFVTVAHSTDTLSPSATFERGIRLPTAFSQT